MSESEKTDTEKQAWLDREMAQLAERAQNEGIPCVIVAQVGIDVPEEEYNGSIFSNVIPDSAIKMLECAIERLEKRRGDVNYSQ